MAFEDLLVALVSNLDDKGFKELDRLENKASRKTDLLSRSLKGLFVGVIGTMGVKAILDANVKLDTLTKSMSALAGSEIGGADQIKYLRLEAERLGQDFVTISDSYKNLFSAGIGTGMDEAQIQSIFSSVMEAGTVLGSSQQQMQGALMALEQMISKGKVSMEELRRQLGNALPGAMQIAARAMGTTSEGLQEMLEAGLDSKKFVTAFGEQLHKEFGEKATEASHTLRAELARLNNAMFDLKTAFLDGEDTKELAEALNRIVKLLRSPALSQSLNGIGKASLFIVKNFRLLFGVAAIIGINRLISYLSLLRLQFLTTSFAAGTLGAALQMDAGIASMKALAAATWATVAPFVRLLVALLLIKEIIDTFRGKKTLLGEIAESMPTVEDTKNFVDKQKNWHNFKRETGDKIYSILHPFRKKENTYLEDSGLYNKDGSPKDIEAIKRYHEANAANGPKMYSAPVTFNSGAVQISVANGDPNTIASVVQTVMARCFRDYNNARFKTITEST